MSTSLKESGSPQKSEMAGESVSFFEKNTISHVPTINNKQYDTIVLCGLTDSLKQEVAYKLLTIGAKVVVRDVIKVYDNPAGYPSVKCIIVDPPGVKDLRSLDIFPIIESMSRKNSWYYFILTNDLIKQEDEYNIKQLRLIINSGSSVKIADQIVQLVKQSNLISVDRRKHIRIPVRPIDKIFVHLLDYDKTRIGKVLNISLGGLFVELKMEPNEDFDLDKTEQNVELQLNRKILPLKCVPVLKQEKYIGLKFVSISEHYQQLIADYILMQMTSDFS